MLKMKFLITILFLTFALSANAQTQTCATVEDCNTSLERAAKQINFLLDVTDADKKLIETQKAEIASRANLAKLDAELIARQKEVIEAQKVEADKLRKLSRPTFSVAWGLVKLRF
jgi:PBP1b-binding outer membrane lipoprotein LpoB